MPVSSSQQREWSHQLSEEQARARYLQQLMTDMQQQEIDTLTTTPQQGQQPAQRQQTNSAAERKKQYSPPPQPPQPQIKNTQNPITQTETSSKEGSMSLAQMFLWLFFAILSDILSLVPVIGIIFSWPFVVCFAAYKWFRLKKGSTLIVSGMVFLAEGFFSSLPACTLDVVLTYMMSRKK